MYAGVTYQTRGSSQSQDIAFIIFATYLMMFIIGQTSVTVTDGLNSISLLSANALSFFMYSTVLSMGLQLRNRPSVFNLTPINWKKRTAYFYITALLITLFIIIGITVFITVMFFIIALVVLITTGEWVFTAGEEEGLSDALSQSLTIGAQGHLFTIFTLLLIIGAATAICLIDSTKLRRILYYAFPVALYIPLFIMINVSNPAKGLTFGGNLAGNFENLPISWLWLVIWALISTGVFAFGVYRLIMRERPKEY